MLHELGPWEHGSEFPFQFEDLGTGPELPSKADFYGSGRDALRALLQYGYEILKWETLWVPSYYCLTVLKEIAIPGLTMASYDDSILDDENTPIEIANAGISAVLILNHFGIRTRSRPIRIGLSKIWVIEDHTHDPWSPLSKSSTADYCIASLRKTIPIPDGGMLWSPLGHELPSCPLPSVDRINASTKKLAGMTLKRLYLDGCLPDKSTSLQLFSEGEKYIASGLVSGMTDISRALLAGFPAARWRRQRIDNFAVAAESLADCPSLEIPKSSSPSAAPYCLFLILPTEQHRDMLRKELIDRNIYPSILWSLGNSDGLSPRDEDLHLSRTSLSLHCDGRYSKSHMTRVANNVRDILDR